MSKFLSSLCRFCQLKIEGTCIEAKDNRAAVASSAVLMRVDCDQCVDMSATSDGNLNVNVLDKTSQRKA